MTDLHALVYTNDVVISSGDRAVSDVITVECGIIKDLL